MIGLSMICPNCQTQNPEGAKFCFNCGTSLALICPNCQTENPLQAKFCFNCGHKFAEPPAAKIAPEPELGPLSVGSSSLDRFVPRELAEKINAARSTRAMVGERRVVTMLFCDVVGSTAASEQLDPEEWTNIMNGAFSYMIEPIYKYEGTVGRLMGDAILAFFGAPIAHEDDPQRAVLAGLDIVEGIETFCEEVRLNWGVDFNVRVGINTGLVVVGAVGTDMRMEYTAMGDAINVAARMEQTAEPGTVQIAEATYRLVAPIFEFQVLGGVEVKGKKEPQPCYRVLGRRTTPGSLRGIEGLRAPMIGREQELGLLRSTVGGLEQGLGSIVCLTGEAGLGKSRLIRELQSDIQNLKTEFTWYESTSLSYEMGQPYSLFQRLVRRVIEAQPDDTPEQLREKIGLVVDVVSAEETGTVRRVFESLFGLSSANGEPPLEGESFKAQLYTVTTSLWRRRSQRRPVILVCDDIHWTDPASIDLLLHLFSLTDEVPLLLLCAQRPDRDAPGWAVKQSAESDYPHRFVEIKLRPLDADRGNELVNNLLRVADLPDSLRTRILEKSDGNPFFVEEVVRTLIDRGVVVRQASPESGALGQAARWRATGDGAEIDIPGNLQTLLMARIDRLAEDAQRALQLASVIGRSFYFRVLSRIVEVADELDASALNRNLITLQRAELIRETARVPELEYVFRHALTQEAAYKTILIAQRKAFHLQVGEAMEALFPDQLAESAALLAHHFSQAGDEDRALKYETMAGDAAFRLFALSEAVEHYGRALELAVKRPASQDATSSETPSTLVHLYARRGRAFENMYDFDSAFANYEEMNQQADERGDRGLKMAYLLAYATVCSTPTPSNDGEKGRELSKQALALAEAIGDRRAEAKARWNLLLYHLNHTSDLAAARQNGEASLRLARELNWERQLAYSLNDLAYVYASLGEPKRGLSVLEEARVYWRKMGNLPMLGDNLNVSGVLYNLIADYASTKLVVDEGQQVARSVGNIWNQMAMLGTASQTYREMGHYERVYDMLLEGIKMGEASGVIEPLYGPVIYLTYLSSELGLIEEGLDFGRQALEYKVLYPSSFRYHEVAYAGQARLHLMNGDLEKAQEIIAKTHSTIQAATVFPYVDIYILPYAFEINFAAGDADGTLAMAQQLTLALENAGIRQGLPDGYYAWGRALLALGRLEEAAEVLAKGRAVAEEAGNRRVLWPILAAMAGVSEAQGDSAAAESSMKQAQSEVASIAADIESERLRASFLARPDVRAVTAGRSF